MTFEVGAGVKKWSPCSAHAKWACGVQHNHFMHDIMSEALRMVQMNVSCIMNYVYQCIQVTLIDSNFPGDA